MFVRYAALAGTAYHRDTSSIGPHRNWLPIGCAVPATVVLVRDALREIEFATKRSEVEEAGSRRVFQGHSDASIATNLHELRSGKSACIARDNSSASAAPSRACLAPLRARRAEVHVPDQPTAQPGCQLALYFPRERIKLAAVVDVDGACDSQPMLPQGAS